MDSSPVVTPPYVAGPFRLDPFRALMLSPSRVGDPASARAFARPYRNVAQRLEDWQAQGHLHRDAEPAVYLHEYSASGMTIRGLVGGLDLSVRDHGPAERVVYPHEGVHPAQVAELAERMTEMGMNPAPILLVHRGPAAVRELLRPVLARAADHEFDDRLGDRHRIWAIREPETLADLARHLAGSRALLADGHHRYAAYLRMQGEAPGTAADRGLAMLVDQDDTPLFLGAIHRILVGTTLEALAKAAASYGVVAACDPSEAVAALAPGTLVATDGREWATVSLELSDQVAAVEVLHESVLPALGSPPDRVEHHHSVDDTLRRLPQAGGIAVLMPAIEFDTVRRIVGGDRLLPEKATSFQPKPSVGALMRSLRDG
ncbi:DUF1015 family protein [Nocardioides sp.]|uniref:DUF1015 family protein n=1 Tax=Nocardioides sp. TaxID=35761 RepID=UPI002D7FEAD5|nr:DUF1015 family protein [Nocardioides sp.]HET8960616.1 DUF1015 family protein [Nocardioides sp.]